MSTGTYDGSRGHGGSHYINDRCRCDECRVAHNARMKRDNARRAERLAADPTLRPHGVYTTYTNWGCRCPECTAANRVRCRSLPSRQRST